MKKAVLKPFFGSWIVSTGDVVFPKLFKNKKEALGVVEHINNRIDHENASRNAN